MRNVQVAPDTAAPDAGGIGGRGRGVDPAEQLAVTADVSDGIDAGCAMLAAELLDLGRERELAAVPEASPRARVGGIEEHAVGRIDGRDWRILVPHRRQVEDACPGDLTNELPHPPRSLVR